MGILTKFSNWYFSRKALPYWGILLIDIFVILGSGCIASAIVYGGAFLLSHFKAVVIGMIVSVVPFIVSFRLLHTYSGILRYSSFVDLYRLFYSVLWGCVANAAIGFIFRIPYSWSNEYLLFPDWKVLLIILFIATLFLFIVRIVVKTLFDVFRRTSETVPAFVYGTYAGGVSIAKSIRNSTAVKYDLKGFISTDNAMTGLFLMGVKVYPDSVETIEMMVAQGVKVLFVSPLQIDHFREQTEIVDSLVQHGIKLMHFGSEEWDGKTDINFSRLKDIQIEDLLPRDKIEIDMNSISRLIFSKTVLITGAAGSIGSEIVRQAASFHPAKMILIDQAETPMHDIRRMMAENYPEVDAVTLVTSVTRKDRMENVFEKYRPDYVFHAAAYKHVPMMEDNPSEAVYNNVMGTRILADLAVRYGVSKFVMISTDKAVNPTNVMGCSKRICEIYCQSLNNAIACGTVKGVTQFVTTRFGNVLGSNGSVVPIFKEQIEAGGPVTVTHPDIVRFFMLIPEACKLVLEAGTMGKGGEIFVFDMGKPVRIADLAAKMIKLSGAKGVEVVYTGLRDGEKLYEEVLADKENVIPTFHPKIKIAKVRQYDYATACENEDRLLEASLKYDDMETVRIMKEIVPEFKSNHSVYEDIDKSKINTTQSE